jgi:FlaA1/EpsC-like NDP-sugar epimerase
MRVPSPTSRSGTRIYVSLWDLFWALVSPVLALYLRDPDIVFRADWNVLGYYWLFSSGFALAAFVALRLQDGMTRYFSVRETLDIAEAALFTELMTFVFLFTLTRLDGIPRSMPLTHGLLLATGLIAARIVVRSGRVDRRQGRAGLSLSPGALHSDRGKSHRLLFHSIA